MILDREHLELQPESSDLRYFIETDIDITASVVDRLRREILDWLDHGRVMVLGQGMRLRVVRPDGTVSPVDDERVSRPVLGLLLAALSGALVGGLIVWMVTR